MYKGTVWRSPEVRLKLTTFNLATCVNFGASQLPIYI